MKKHILLALLSFFIFSVATIYITYPLIFHLTDFASGEYVISWIFNWNIHSILTGNIFHIFDANIYTPFPLSLAYSDTHFIASIIALPAFLLLKEPIVPANITFLTSLLFLGFSTYLLSYFLTKNFFASLLSGFLLIFCPIMLDKRVHLQMLAIEWIPLSLLFFFYYLKTGKFRHLFFCLLFFVIQTYNSFLPGYFLMFFFITSAGICFFTNKKCWEKFFQWKILFAFLAAFLIIVPIAIPYYTISQKYDYVRNIRDAIHFAIQPEDLLIANDNSRLVTLTTWFKSSPSYPAYAEVQSAFPGIAITILSICSTVYFLKQKKKNMHALSFVFTGLLGLTLAFGPAMHWARQTVHHPFLIPLPYGLFYYLIPGFQGFRNSARFEVLFVLGISFASAIFLTDVLKRKSRLLNVVVYAFLFAITIGECNFPMHFDKAPTFAQFPPVYSWIAHHTPKNAVILETPMYNWDNNPFGNNQEVMREYYSVIHFRKIIGGGSGFSPPPWQQLAIEMFNDFPSEKMLMAAKRIGVTYIVVHKKEYDILSGEKWKSRGRGVKDGTTILNLLNDNSAVTLITNLGDDYIYKVLY